jgi:hypothetical protein
VPGWWPCNSYIFSCIVGKSRFLCTHWQKRIFLRSGKFGTFGTPNRILRDAGAKFVKFHKTGTVPAKSGRMGSIAKGTELNGVPTIQTYLPLLFIYPNFCYLLVTTVHGDWIISVRWILVLSVTTCWSTDYSKPQFLYEGFKL